MGVRRKHVESLARQVLAEAGVSEPPVPVEQLAKQFGLDIRPVELDEELSGFLYQDGSQLVIGVNDQQAISRRRFTIAHELGHYLLHHVETLHVDHGFQIKWRDGRSSTGMDSEEIEANLFAAELLMPQSFISQDMRQEKSADLLDDIFISRLAGRYQVSGQALVYRLTNLGYADR